MTISMTIYLATILIVTGLAVAVGAGVIGLVALVLILVIEVVIEIRIKTGHWMLFPR